MFSKHQVISGRVDRVEVLKCNISTGVSSPIYLTLPHDVAILNTSLPAPFILTDFKG
jgi:hypothetical protein